MTASLRSLVSFTLCLALTSACTSPGSAPDTGSGDDAATPRDVGTDAGTTLDGGSDASVGPDTGLDAAAGDDAFTPGDDAFVEIPDASGLPDVMLGDAAVPAPCPVDQDRCGGDACLDLTTELDHCGACGTSCMGPNVLGAACVASRCVTSACTPGFAEIDHDPSNGCEAAQDFSITLASSTVTASTGGSATLGIVITRTNGFPYSISVNATGLPSGVSQNGTALTLDDAATITFTVAPLAFTGSYPITISASSSVAGTIVTHTLPATLDVTSSSVVLSSVTPRDAGGVLPGSMARQNAGTITLRLAGSGFTTITGATLEELPLTLVPGGTDTMRDYTTSIPPNATVPGDGRPLTLVLTTTTGAVTFGGALVLSRIAASPSGDDTSGRGTLASPYRTLARAFAAAGSGSSVVLAPGTYDDSVAAGGTAVPSGLVSIERVAESAATVTIGCGATPATSDTSLSVQGPLHVRDVTLACPIGIGAPGGTAPMRVDLVNVSYTGTGEAAMLPAGSNLFWDGGTISGHLGSSGSAGVGATTLRHLYLEGVTVTTTTPSLELADVVFEGTGGGLVATAASSCTLDGVVIGQVLGDGQTGIALTSSHCSLDRVIGGNGGGHGTGLRFGDGVVASVGRTVLEHFGGYAPSHDAAIVVEGAGITLDMVFGSSLQPDIVVQNGIGIFVHPVGGDVTLTMDQVDLSANGVGLHFEGEPGRTTNATLSAGGIRENDVGIRIAAGPSGPGITNLAFPSALQVNFSTGSPTDVLFDVGPGTGTLALTSAQWFVTTGRGIVVSATSMHTITLGSPDGSALVFFDTTGHPYDFAFALEDRRTGTVAPIPVRGAMFRGSDGVIRTWSGTFTGPTGSYSSSVSPRDLASWVVTRTGSLAFTP